MMNITVNKSSRHSIMYCRQIMHKFIFINKFESIITKNHESYTENIDSVHTVCFLMSDGDNNNGY